MRFEITKKDGCYSLFVNEELIGDSFEDWQHTWNRIKKFLEARFP